MAITADIKKKHLKSLSLALRHELEGYFASGQWHAGDLEQRLMSLGVRRERDALPIDEMAHLPDYDQRARKKVDQYLALRTAAGLSREGAVAEFVRETAYTWANRLLALRCMEARELIDEVILQKAVYSGRSLEHNRLLRARPELASQEDDGLFLALEQAFARLATHLALLFDPHASSVALRPSPAALKRCIMLLSSGDGAVFKEPDALGWAYQFWNTEENKRVFEAVRLKKAKIAGADIIPATQLYTEPYMVKFLVQNSLGATWMGMHPESKLAESWEYFVRDADRAPIAEKDRQRVAELSFLDPACGSGHFLLEAFDLLFAMYKEEGVVTDDVAICQHILEKNLYGIDIDERAVQIAEAALWSKAKERAFDFTSAKTNLVATNLRLPKDKNHLQLFLDKHPEDEPLKEALEKIFAGLANADQLGSLLQIAEPVEKELRAIKEQEDKKQLAYLGNKQRTRFDVQPQSTAPGMKQFDIAPQTVLPVGVENWDTWRTQTGQRLRTHFAEEAEAADLGQQFFSAQASRGWRLFELLGRRYDVVAANPPYMGSKNMGPIIKEYIKNNWKEAKRDLYAAFMLRSLSLCKPSGFIAMVSQHAWLSLKQMHRLRNMVLSNTHIYIISHIGPGAFEEISGNHVNVVMFVFQNLPTNDKSRITAIRTSWHGSIEQKKRDLIYGAADPAFPGRYSILQSTIQELPGQPIVYSARPFFIKLLKNTNTLGKKASVSYTASANQRSVRFHWEAPSNGRWISYSKGGGFRRWSGLNLYFVDWGVSGERISNFIEEAYDEDKYSLWIKADPYPNQSIVWSEIGSGAMGARRCPPNTVVSRKGPAVMSSAPGLLLCVVGWLNSRVATYLLRLKCSGIDFSYSYVANLFFPDINYDQKIINYAISIGEKIASLDPCESSFVYQPNPIKRHNLLSAGLCSIEACLDSVTNQALGLDELDIKVLNDELGTMVADYPLLDDSDKDVFTKELGLDFLDSEGIFTNRAEKNPEADNSNLCSRVISEFLSYYGKSHSLHGDEDRAGDDEVAADPDDDDDDSEESFKPIPSASAIEFVAREHCIHPLSVYRIICEGESGNPALARLFQSNTQTLYLSVTILRLLGHRWPRQIEAGEVVPDWADQDGIIPFTAGTPEATLYDRVRSRIAADFPAGEGVDSEREFAESMGKPLDRWLETDFFKHHSQQFKKRPIAWQLQSSKFTAKRKPAFACLLYYHKLDGDTLPKLRSQYVGPLRQRLETELRGIEAVPKEGRSDRQQSRLRELAEQLSELRDFDKKLEQVQTSGFVFTALAAQLRAEPLDAQCSPDGIRPPPADEADFLRQEQSYLPDSNDGVRVNIAPLQQAGVLATEVLAGKDLDKAITDRATWRSDERRWSRAGKLPQPGYFRVKPQPSEDGAAA